MSDDDTIHYYGTLMWLLQEAADDNGLLQAIPLQQLAPRWRGHDAAWVKYWTGKKWEACFLAQQRYGEPFPPPSVIG